MKVPIKEIVKLEKKDTNTEYFLKESLKYYEKEKYEAIEPYYKHLCEKEIERINKEIKKDNKVKITASCFWYYNYDYIDGIRESIIN